MSKILKQYNELKEKDASSIYIFRIGIFYNILNEDAKILNEKLGLKITSLSTQIIDMIDDDNDTSDDGFDIPDFLRNRRSL